MSGFETAMSLASLAVGTAGTIANQQAQKKQANIQSQAIAAQQAQQAEAKRNLLTKQLANQRAKMASSGVSDSASTDALMNGLVDQTESSIADAAADASLQQGLLDARDSGSALAGLQTGLSAIRSAKKILDNA